MKEFERSEWYATLVAIMHVANFIMIGMVLFFGFVLLAAPR